MLKPRQKGSTTFAGAVVYCDLRREPKRALLIGGKDWQAGNVLGKIKTYLKHDKFDGWGVPDNGAGASSTAIVFRNGSLAEPKTANVADSGRSATLQDLVATEVAFWNHNPHSAANDSRVLKGALACVHEKAGTTVILESTANGKHGTFYDRWMLALDFHEYKRRWEAGELVAGQYIRVFVPWLDFEECSISLSPEQKRQIKQTLSSNEEELMSDPRASFEKIAWRRMKISTELEGDAEMFEQEYPRSWQTAFLTSGRLRFADVFLRELTPVEPQRGHLEISGEGAGLRSRRVRWRVGAGGEFAEFLRWREPEEGRTYLVAADVCTGASQQHGRDPDCNVALVLRKGFLDEAGKWWRPAVVARTRYGNRDDADVFVEQLLRLSLYYGSALIVPEVNNPGLSVVNSLKRRIQEEQLGIGIYQREVFDERTQRREKQLGWHTSAGDGGTRRVLIDAIGAALRTQNEAGGGLDLPDGNIIDQLWNFTINDKGKAEGFPHDDDVMALGIGLATLDRAWTKFQGIERIRRHDRAPANTMGGGESSGKRAFLA
ncbi:MAG: hypothetical protein LBS59_04000 [Puniceicoccales bacterium]|nr:hypothetical protein [Puniceicoccales bacterium]